MLLGPLKSKSTIKMRVKITIFLVLFLFTSIIEAQTSEDSDQPKVGLVLSGGGAKGFAHIGALKVIDSLGIKIDYVAGTSMGAIIGGLYAAGYSGQDLDSIFQQVNIEDLVNDVLPRSSRTFYERDIAERYAVTLPFNNFELKLPSALSRGQNVYGLLNKLTLHIKDIDNFENLPIPFFAMATNAETGEAVILERGNLALAVRASGSLPSLFQPVIIDGTVLIDGGVVNNYPVDELRAKGMDVIIGVDVQDGLSTIEEMDSVLDVLIQVNNFRTIKAMEQKREKTDVYIKPDIGDFTVLSFNEGQRIIRSGETATRDKLSLLSDLPQRKKSTRPEIHITPQDTIIFDDIKITGNNHYSRAYILGKLRIKQKEKTSLEDFTEGINNLIATNNFELVYYDFKETYINGRYILVLRVEESNVTTFLKFGVHYDDLYKSAALANFTKKRLLFDNDLLSLDVILGDNVRYDFNYLIDKGFYWSVGIKSRFNQFTKNVNPNIVPDSEDIIPEDVNFIEIELHDQTNQLYLQTIFIKDFALVLGGEHKRLSIKSETISGNMDEADITFENTDYFSTFGNLKLDTYNNRYYPRKGFYFNGDFHLYLLASDFNDDFSQFSIAKADLGYAMSFTDKFSVNITSSGGFKVGDDSTRSLNFALGGYGNNFINNFISFFGYEHISLIGNSFVKGGLTLNYEIFKKNHILFTANYANVENDIFETGEWLTAPDYSGYAIGYGLETFLGPIEARYTWSPETNSSIWLFNIGFWF